MDLLIIRFLLIISLNISGFLFGYAINKAGFSLEEQMGESGSPIIRDMIKEQLDSAGIKLSSDEHVIVEINPDDEYVIDGKHKALVLR